MPILRKFVFALIGAWWPCLLGASIAMPGDGPYRRLMREQTQYTFESADSEAIPQIGAYHDVFRRMYDQSFGWHLDERQDLILTSPRQQIANAYATIIPNIKSVWYPSGGEFLDMSAASSWSLLLDAHETAHLYQLNAKAELPARLSRLLGNADRFSLFVWPIFIHPNLYTPGFLMEGNAVLNESRVNMGGRLHSGELRALVLAQIKAGEIDPTRLINDEFRFPFSSVAYYQGGYFQAHLAGKYGIDKTNQFFKAQGERYLWPFLLNKTFRQHFGASYPQEIREYVREMESLAKNQTFTQSPILIAGTFVSPFNHDNDRIWFTISEGKAPPDLIVYDKRHRTFTAQRRDLRQGKVFFEGDIARATSSDRHDLHHVEYSLYGEGNAFDPRYRGQIVTDQRAGKTISLEASRTWLENKILVDGAAYDVTASSPILDEGGAVYYFRQNGGQRVLYKNREPVFKYDGYYGKLTEVGADGTIYFIANSDYGSTLYRYADNEVSRVLSSDVVIDARRIDDRDFLISEVDHLGYKIRIAGTDLKATAPANFAYPFATEVVVPDRAEAVEQVQADQRAYDAFSTLRYSSLDFTSSYSSTSGFGVSLATQFTDPLEYQSIGLAYVGTQFRDQGVVAQYTLTKYLASWVSRYRYKERWWERPDGTDQKSFDQDVATGISLPLLRWRRWDARTSLSAIYEKEDMRNRAGSTRADIEERYGARSTFNLVYQNRPPVGMFAWREFSVGFINKLQSQPNEWKTRYNTSITTLKYELGFKRDFFLSLFGTAAWAINRDIKLSYSQSPLTEDVSIPILTGHKDYVAKTAGAARVEVHKVLSTPQLSNKYSARIPLGLERLAPFVVAQGIALDDDSAKTDPEPHNIFEWGYGVDLHLLIFHRQPAMLRLLRSFNTTDSAKAETQATLNFKREF